ncbi:MAG: DEAD/DEAH box helicase [Methanoregula sp.]|uniref:DEAD/DEAH box helicase n=1 Tax=Methanoregula sp. TaxID=2052170 RepID=UPI003C482840
MKIIVQPVKGSYKLLFYDGKHVHGVGIAEMADTPKGPRPVKYRLRWGSRKEYRATPSKDLVAQLREGDVRMVRPDPLFEEFLHSFQIRTGTVDVCRICLLDDRYTPLTNDNFVIFGKSEKICLDCGRRELRRELAPIGHMGRDTLRHFEELLDATRNLDRVLALVQPEKLSMKSALFDRIEAHPVLATAKLEELPLPHEFVVASRVESLMPAQQLAVDAGLLFGKDLLVVAATASGKTFIGEMAGMKNYLAGRGRMLFLVPLVALANQKYERFTERYGALAKTGLLTGVSRLNLPETRKVGDRNPQAPILVGTYEGVDNMIRCGQKMHNIGTVVIDEVQMLEDPERGHRLDGLVARLKYLAPQAQYLYLSATIGSPKTLAKKLNCQLVRYDDRPVALERFLLFTERKQKIPTIKKLTTEEYKNTSSKGYRGQTIIFTNARARCHTIADALGMRAAAYHAGLSAQERREVETKFLGGKLMAVVTTAALGAGVDFPASQVIFDALAMGREWLSVQEFNQMAGRAGRPDFHDLGRVVLLAEPGGSYSREHPGTEEEIALRLLKGQMEEVAPVHDLEQSSEEYVANAVACGGEEADLAWINATMVGSMEPVLPELVAHRLVQKKGTTIELSPLARVMSEHFIGIERLLEIVELAQKMDDPLDIIAELESEGMEKEAAQKKERGGSHQGGKKGHGRR